jgi:hypothetical protein
MVGWGGFAALVAAVGVGVTWRVDWLTSVALIGMPPWAIATVVLLPQLYAGRIDKRFVRVKGCGRDFLDSLPEFLE